MNCSEWFQQNVITKVVVFWKHRLTHFISSCRVTTYRTSSTNKQTTNQVIRYHGYEVIPFWRKISYFVEAVSLLVLKLLIDYLVRYQSDFFISNRLAWLITQHKWTLRNYVTTNFLLWIINTGGRFHSETSSVRTVFSPTRLQSEN